MGVCELIPDGWNVNQKYHSRLTDFTTRDAVQRHLVVTDIREYGMSWLDSFKTKDVIDGDGKILQISRLRNIAISQAEEDFLTSASSSGPRLLRLALTDGKDAMPALDLDNSPKLSMETSPGTKIRLIGRVPVRCGFLLLRRNNFDVLNGTVEHLHREWLLTKDIRGSHRLRQTGIHAPPPFAAYGTKESSKLILSHTDFFSNLRSTSSNQDQKFDSLKLAMSSTTKVSNATENDSTFDQKRREVVALVQKEKEQNYMHNGQPLDLNHKFVQGGSKFAVVRAELAEERDRNLAELVSMGYPIALANSALDASRNNLRVAIDRLSSKAMDSSLSFKPTNRDTRGSRGSRRGRSNFDPDIEDDPRFQPELEAERCGLKGKPSTGSVPLTDYISSPLQANMGRPKFTNSELGTQRLPPGTVILAKNIYGEFQPAQVWRLLPKMAGESAATVSYLDKEGTQEEVPLTMLRTLDKCEIYPSMLEPSSSSVSDSYHSKRSEPGLGYRSQSGDNFSSSHGASRSFRGSGGRRGSSRGRGGFTPSSGRSFGRGRGGRRA